MIIAQSDPPNIALIDEVFPNRGPGVMYAYGDTIYNPSGQFIPGALIAHEEAHGVRQVRLGVDEWWQLYVESPEFRYREELYGHAAELRALRTKDRNVNTRLLMQTTLRLLAPFYEYGKTQRHFMDAQRDLVKLAEAA